MTREYERPEYRGGGRVMFHVEPGDNYFYVSVNRGNPKRMAVKDNLSGYVFKLNKTCISAKDGVNGLFKFVDDCLYEGFMDCYAWKVLDHVLENGK